MSTTLATGDSVGGQETDNKTISSENYEKGYRYNTHGWIYLHIEGEPYERGYQHGYLLGYEIIDMLQRWIDVFPQEGAWEFQRNSAVRLFWDKYPKEYKEEIKGIADGVVARGGKIDGSVVDYKDILALNEMYEANSRFRNYKVHPLKLSSNWLIGKIGSLIKYLKTSSKIFVIVKQFLFKVSSLKNPIEIVL